jgi:hypothetical protein
MQLYIAVSLDTYDKPLMSLDQNEAHYVIKTSITSSPWSI